MQKSHNQSTTRKKTNHLGKRGESDFQNYHNILFKCLIFNKICKSHKVTRNYDPYTGKKKKQKTKNHQQKLLTEEVVIRLVRQKISF